MVAIRCSHPRGALQFSHTVQTAHGRMFLYVCHDCQDTVRSRVAPRASVIVTRARPNNGRQPSADERAAAMTAATREQAQKLLRDIQDRLREFERTQALVRARVCDIRDGRVSRNDRRTPTKVLVRDRDAARERCVVFLDGLSEEEYSILAIAGWMRDWRAEYDKKLDPANDPAL